MNMGDRIAAARRARGLTQEQLAEQIGVSFQAVSTWERGENTPDTQHLLLLARVLDRSVESLTAETTRDWPLRDRLFDEERMYTFVKARAQALGLRQTLKALPLARERHAGQVRKGAGAVPYLSHPLTMACHALAMGLADDDVLAALLLHDVAEDTGMRPDELPVGERVREAVRLVSYNTYDGPKETIQPLYYENIGKNALASLVKCVDRCSNLSCMAMGFTREKMADYVEQTERDVMPLLDTVKAVPEWNSAAWLLQYQITALLETFKRIL